MTTPITSIRNFGPAMAASCQRAGLHTAEDIRALGTDETYRRLLLAGSRPHFIAYYVIEMGLQGRPWTDCQGKEKEALRLRFDALVASTHDPHLSDFEKALNEIGVLPPANPPDPSAP